MTTGIDLIAAAARFLGEPYNQGPGRTDPTSGYKDCSGLIVASCSVAGVPMPATVSVYQYKYCRDNGSIITLDEAAAIAGALLFCPEDPSQGWGNNGHVGFSAGDGTTVEATPPAVQRLSIHYQPWSWTCAGLIPGVDYTNGGHGTPVPIPIPGLPRKDNEDMNWLVQSERVKGTPAVYWCRGDSYSWVKDLGIIGYLEATLPPEQLHVADPIDIVGEDWLGMFNLVGEDFKPGSK